MNEHFPTLQSVRTHARQAFEAGHVRVAPVRACLEQWRWEGLHAWYNEYDLASGKEFPYEGANFPPNEWPSNSIEAD